MFKLDEPYSCVLLKVFEQRPKTEKTAGKDKHLKLISAPNEQIARLQTVFAFS